MTALADPSSWRETYSHRGYLFLLKPTVVFSGLINQTSFTYPLTSLTVDTTSGSSANVREGMLLLLGTAAGQADLGRQIVKSATSTTIALPRTSQGVNDGELNPANNMFFTILDFYPPWAKIPYIDPSSGVSRKFAGASDVAFDASTVQIPVANGGGPVADFVDPDSDTLTVPFSSGAFTVASGATLSTHAWDFGDGTPSSSSSANPGSVSFPPGFRYAHYTVTDNGSRSHTTHIPVYTAERSGTYAPIYDFEVVNETHAENSAMSFRVYEAIDADDYPFGTLVMYFEDEWYGGELGSLAGATGRESLKYIGYLTREPAVIEAEEIGLRRFITLESAGLGGKLAQLPGFSEYIKRVTSPSRWEHMANLDIWRLFVHHLRWNTTALEIAPLQQSSIGSTYPMPAFELSAQSPAQAADYMARAIAYRCTVTPRGIMKFLPEPQLAPTAAQVSTYSLSISARTSTSMVTLGADDVRSINYAENPVSRLHWLRGEAVYAEAAVGKVKSLFCVSPGTTPGQGAQSQTEGKQIASSQNELNVRNGNAYRRANAPQDQFDILLSRSGDGGLDPAEMEWITLSISAEVAAQRGLVISSGRFLVLRREVRHSQVNGMWVKDVTLTVERETSGIAAKTVIPPKVPKLKTPVISVPKFDIPMQWPNSFLLPTVNEISPSARLALAFIGQDLRRTSDFNTPQIAGGPTWDTFTLGTSGSIGGAISMCIDPFSPAFTTIGSTLVDAWVATTTRLYYVENIFSATPTITLVHIFANSVIATGTNKRRVVRASALEQNHVMVISYYDSSGGVTCTYSTLGATNGTYTEVTVDANYESSGANQQTVLAMSEKEAGKAWTIAFTATGSRQSATAALFETPDYGATWAEVTGAIASLHTHLGQCLHAPVNANSNEDIFYWTETNIDKGTSINLTEYHIMRSTDTLNEDIAPEAVGQGGGNRFFGPGREGRGYGITSCRTNRQLMMMAALDRAENTAFGAVFKSFDAGDSWQVVIEPSSSNAYQDVRIADDGRTVFLYGTNILDVSQDFGVSWESRLGNLSGTIKQLVVI